jgi:UDP-3-O-[3-hydroxymyristoyl] glucosamine N-acyltransferase
MHLSFLANRRYTRTAKDSQAGAILAANDVDLPGRALVRVEDPYAGFALIMQHFHPYISPPAGMDPKAWVAPDAQVSGARIEAFAWVGPGAVVGPGTWIETGAVVGAHAKVGRDCRLMPKAVVMDGCTIGDRVWLNPGAVVGAEGFGFAPSAKGHLKIPQAGDVRIGDDVEVGANSCVDRAALGTTHVRSFAKLDNLVQVGHAADVGEGALMVAYSGVAGSTRLGSGVVLAAKAAVLGHLDIGAGTQVGVASAVTHNQEPGSKVTGIPAIEHRKWLRSVNEFAGLPDLVKRVRELEKRLEEIEGKS